MKKTILCLLFLFISISQGWTSKGCLIIQKEGCKVLTSEGDCETRYSPCSTFKIILALMGYDARILEDETHPEWPFEEGYEAFLESWKNPQNPTTWMKNSCVWYSQVLTPKLGIEKFQGYIKKLGYGNQNISGDQGQNNGLTNSWLSSSLEISPQEQGEFLERLLENKLPVSDHAQKMTRNILFVEDLLHGWKLYGKTGSGFLLNSDRTKKLDVKHGWFIGWIEKGDRKIIFVNHIVDDKKEEKHAGPRAKDQVKQKLLELIEQIENNI